MVPCGPKHVRKMKFEFIKFLLAFLLVYLLTPASRVLLEKLTDLQLIKKLSRIFMEPEGSLPHSQVPVTCPCPEPDGSSPYPHIPLPEDPT